jgi:hypothetical protein
MTRNNVGFTVHLIFYTMQRCLTGSLPAMKRGVFNKTLKQNAMACSGNREFIRQRGKKKVLLAVQNHAYVFLQAHGDSSL